MFYSREINKIILRKYVIHKSGNGEIRSRLTIPAAEDHDGGQYLCVAENKVTRILVILLIAQIYLCKMFNNIFARKFRKIAQQYLLIFFDFLKEMLYRINKNYRNVQKITENIFAIHSCANALHCNGLYQNVFDIR